MNNPLEEFGSGTVSDKMSDAQTRTWLLATYGACEVCGEPRCWHSFTETHLDGSTTSWKRLFCTSDWRHGLDIGA